MDKRFLYIFFIWLVTTAVQAQTTWLKTYGGSKGEGGFDVQQTEDGGYIVIGNTDSYGTGSVALYLIKTDSMGDTLWTRTFGGSNTDVGICVHQTFDYGYMIVGTTYSFSAGSGDVYLVKTDEKGDTLWTRNYGSSIVEAGYSGQQTTDGGYIMSGYSLDGGILIKTDSLGDTLWIKKFERNILSYGWDVQQTDDGGYILTGEARGLAALVKTDTLGRTLWSNHFGAKRHDRSYSVRQTTDGGYILAGIQYVPGGTESDSRAFLVKTDASGDTLWTRKLGDDVSAGKCVRETSEGGYIITGFHRYGWENYIYLLKTDEKGFPVWSRFFGDGEGEAVRQTSDGGYIITGDIYIQNHYDPDIILIKTDGSGNITGVKNHHEEESPKYFKLYQNYPNPFNESTNIVYEVFGDNQDIRLVIYDLSGKEVRILLEKHQYMGMYGIPWDGRDDGGKEVTSGVYLVQLEGGGRWKVNKKLLLLR